jgi:hypothetical protein
MGGAARIPINDPVQVGRVDRARNVTSAQFHLGQKQRDYIRDFSFQSELMRFIRANRELRDLIQR